MKSSNEVWCVHYKGSLEITKTAYSRAGRIYVTAARAQAFVTKMKKRWPEEAEHYAVVRYIPARFE